MSQGGARLLTATRGRAVRSLAAMSLLCSVAFTGFVALAIPAHAAAAAPTLVTASSTASPGNTKTPTVAFTGTGLLYECQVAGVSTWKSCFSPWTVPALGADGDYALQVRQRSLSNDGTLLTETYHLDTIAQATVTGPTLGKSATPTWTISPEPSGTATCVFDGGPSTACNSSFTAPTITTEGNHTLVVTAHDPLNNPSAAISASYTYDITPPATPVVTGSSGTDNLPSLAWSWANAGGDLATCTLHTPSGAGTPTACTTKTSFTQAITTEGDYSLDVLLTDAAGNATPLVSSPTYTLDTTPPPAPVFTSGPTGSGTTTSVTWAFTATGSSTFCQLIGTSSPAQASFPCSSPTTVTLPDDDSWKLGVVTSDPSGNTSSTTSASYLLDTTGPDAPTVSGPATLSNNAHPHFTWIGELPSSAVCRLLGPGATDVGAWTDCTARAFDPTLTQDGNYQAQAQLTDPLGNVGAIGTSAVYAYDGTAPAAPTLTTPATPGNSTSPTVTFTLESGGTARCSFYAGTVAPSSPTTTDCSSGSYSPTLGADGVWTLSVALVDAAGNVGTASTWAYTLDTTGPTAVVLTGSASAGSGRFPSWTLQGDGDSTLSCRLLRGTTVIATATSCTTTYAADLTGQVDGTYTLEVVAKDAAGNAVTSTSSYLLDTAPPSSPVVTGPATSPGNAPSPSWTFPVQSNTTAQCRLTQGSSHSAWSDCSSGTFTVPAIPDGTYTVDVLVTDEAGNSAPLASSASYTSDRTAPDAPTVSGPAGYGRTTNVSWTWTAEPGVTAMCRLDRAGVIGSYQPCNSGSFYPTLSGDTSYVVAVYVVDAAGNVSTVTTSASYTLDTGVPLTPAVSGPTGSSSVPTVVWTWNGEAGATSSCTLVANGLAGTPTTCTSGASVTLPSDGTYQLQVRITDAAGNTSTPGTSGTYTLDRVAPSAPTVSAPTSPSNALMPSFVFTAEAGATTECSLVRIGTGSGTLKDWASCTSPVSYDLTGQPDATYAVQVRATDAALNTGSVGSSLGYQLDTTAPATAVVTVPTNPSQSTTPTFSWTGEPGATAMCRLVKDGVAQNPVSCASPWTPTLTGDGSWVLRVRLTDAAGNVSTAGVGAAYVLDTTAPTTPVVSAPTSPGRGTNPSWSATYETGATTECRLSSGTATGPVLSPWSSCVLPLTTDLTTRGDGTYVLSVRVTDEVGLVSPVGSASYVLDTTAPAAPTFTAQPASPGNSKAISFSFTSEPGASLFCRLTSGATVVSPETACTSPLPVSLAGLTDGTYTLSARAVDAAGNAGPAQSSTYVLDTVAPAAPVLVSAPAAVSPNRRPNWTFTSESGTTVSCKVTGALGYSSSLASCTSPFSPNLTAQPDDTYTFTATAKDAAGNVGPALTSKYVLDATAPLTATVVGPASPGRNTSPSWQVSSTDGVVQCRFTKGATVLSDWATCGPVFTASLPSSGGDGTYTLSARVLDALGNPSPPVTSTYLLDTTAPSAATLTSPASPATDRAPTWTVSSTDTGVTASCQITGPTGALAPFAACGVSAAGAAYNLTLPSSAQDGTYTLTVRLTDTAGNVGPDAHGSYVLDTTPPSTVTVTPPTSPSNSATPSWGLVGDSDASLECRLSGPGFTSPTFSACPAGSPGTSTYTGDLTAKADGTYTLTVRSRDLAGNLGQETASSYVLDRVAPAVPAAPTVGASPSNNPIATWTFSVDAGATALCTLTSSTTVISSDAVCTSPLSTDFTSFGNGDFSLTVRAQDAAGNTSAASPAATYTLDTEAPAAPVFTSLPGTPSPIADPIWTVTAEPGAVLKCKLSGVDPDFRVCPGTGSTIQYTLTDQQSYVLQVTQVDAAGNTSKVVEAPAYVYDADAPNTPIVTPPKSPSNVTTPVFVIGKHEGDVDTDSFACEVTRFDDKVENPGPACVQGANVVDLTDAGPGSDGMVTLAVKGVDKAKNSSAASSAIYEFDNTPPPSPDILELKDSAGFSDKVTWNYGKKKLDTDPVTYQCVLARTGTVVVPIASVPCGKQYDATLASYGSWTLSVWAVDVAGNFSLHPATSTYTYLPPVPVVTNVKAPVAGDNATPTWTFTVPRGYTATCLVSDAHGSTIATGDCTSGRFTPDLRDLPAGVYSLSAQLHDSIGNDGAYSAKSAYRYAPDDDAEGHLGHTGPGTTTHSPPPSTTDHDPNPPSHLTPPTTPVPPTHTSVSNDDPTPPHGVPVTQDSGPAVSSGSKTGGKHVQPRSDAISLPGAKTFINQQVPQAIGKTLAQVAQKPTIPLVLLVVVVGFLLLQNRIDRRDPKLASAPVGAEPEMDFGPVRGVSPRELGGGATA